MLPIKSKFKIGKRLGAGVFEQLQTQKFALSAARKKEKKGRGRRGGSDYGLQLLEKQRVRYSYGLSERQLSNYAAKAYVAVDPSAALHRALELRADNVVYRAGYAPTRRAARQAVSHGHFTVNGKRITTPSQHLNAGDVIAVREGNRTSPLYAGLAERENVKPVPAWLKVDITAYNAEVTGDPQYNLVETGLDYRTVFEFYSR